MTKVEVINSLCDPERPHRESHIRGKQMFARIMMATRRKLQKFGIW